MVVDWLQPKCSNFNAVIGMVVGGVMSGQKDNQGLSPLSLPQAANSSPAVSIHQPALTLCLLSVCRLKGKQISVATWQQNIKLHLNQFVWNVFRKPILLVRWWRALSSQPLPPYTAPSPLFPSSRTNTDTKACTQASLYTLGSFYYKFYMVSLLHTFLIIQ